MNNLLRSILVFALLSISALSYAQYDPVLSIGGGIGMGFGVNESNDRPLGFSGRLSLLYVNGFGKYISPEIGINTLSLSSGKEGGYFDYRTSVIVPDLRLYITPYGLNKWSPYLFGAVGYALRSISYAHDADPSVANTGGDIAFGGGIGLYHRMNTNWAVNFHVGGMITTADNLNPATDGRKDGWWQGMINFHYLFASDEAPPTPQLEQKKVVVPNPDNLDEDNDGFTRHDETTIYHTNPQNPDSDGDGLSDGEEVKRYRTDPNKKDSDGDGLSDGGEVNKYGTDPLKADTDGDGLSDGDEVMKFKTNPLARDTDGDQLNDGDEIHTHKTNPLDPDTDKGGVLDGPEVRRGTDPLNPKDDKK